MIDKHVLLISFLNKAELIFLHSKMVSTIAM